jgi:heat shock protein HslJ
MRRPTAIVIGAAVVAAGALVLVLGSTSSGAGAPTPVTSLEEVTGTWEATESTDAPAELAAPVRLTFAEGGVFVETGCNTGRGAATVEAGLLVAGPFATTRKACVPPLDTQEQWVLVMLESTPRMGLAGTSELTLTWGEGYALLLTRVADAATGRGPSPAG